MFFKGDKFALKGRGKLIFAKLEAGRFRDLVFLNRYCQLQFGMRSSWILSKVKYKEMDVADIFILSNIYMNYL